MLFAPQQQIGTVPLHAAFAGRIHTDMVYDAAPCGNEGGAKAVSVSMDVPPGKWSAAPETPSATVASVPLPS